jgi:hypothetical protein
VDGLRCAQECYAYCRGGTLRATIPTSRGRIRFSFRIFPRSLSMIPVPLFLYYILHLSLVRVSACLSVLALAATDRYSPVSVDEDSRREVLLCTTDTYFCIQPCSISYLQLTSLSLSLVLTGWSYEVICRELLNVLSQPSGASVTPPCLLLPLSCCYCYTAIY